MTSRISKRNETTRRVEHKVDEVITGICVLLGNDASDAAFIKSRYSYSTCTNSCNDGVNLKNSLVDLILHGSRNT